MAEKVELVIKIPKYYLTHPQDYTCLAECVRRGKPLPKVHGRLIDVKQIVYEKECVYETDGCCTTRSTPDIDATPTIIEADKVESEEV